MVLGSDFEALTNQSPSKIDMKVHVQGLRGSFRSARRLGFVPAALQTVVIMAHLAVEDPRICLSIQLLEGLVAWKPTWQIALTKHRVAVPAMTGNRHGISPHPSHHALCSCSAVPNED